MEEIETAIAAWTVERTQEAVLAAMEQAEVPAGRIYSAADIAADPHYAARGMIEQIVAGDGEPLKVPGIVPKLSATPGAIRSAAPKLGEHTDEILGALGYSGRRDRRTEKGRNLMIDHIDHIVLTTRDLEGCIRFYGEVLGMKLERFRDANRASASRSCSATRKSMCTSGAGSSRRARMSPRPGTLDLCFIAARAARRGDREAGGGRRADPRRSGDQDRRDVEDPLGVRARSGSEPDRDFGTGLNGVRPLWITQKGVRPLFVFDVQRSSNGV